MRWSAAARCCSLPEGRTIGLGEVQLHVLPPPRQQSWGHNDNSVGLVVEYGAFRASLTGDAEARLANWWLATANERLEPVQLHKASHHGSAAGDTDALLARLRPEVVVVSVGAYNRYGHPHAAALARYAAVGATVYRTDHHGTVIITAEPDGTFEVTTSSLTPPSQRAAGARDTP
jgi:competence protein ComEC